MSKQKSNALKNAPKQAPQYKTEKNEKTAASTLLDGYLPILAVLTLTLLAFLPTFQSEFVNWDDDLNITKNKFINELSIGNIRNKRLFVWITNAKLSAPKRARSIAKLRMDKGL